MNIWQGQWDGWPAMTKNGWRNGTGYGKMAANESKEREEKIEEKEKRSEGLEVLRRSAPFNDATCKRSSSLPERHYCGATRVDESLDPWPAYKPVKIRSTSHGDFLLLKH